MRREFDPMRKTNDPKHGKPAARGGRRKQTARRAAAGLLVLLLCLQLVTPVFAGEGGDAPAADSAAATEQEAPAASADLTAEVITVCTAEDLRAVAQACALDTWSQGRTILLQSDILLDDCSFLPIPTFGGTFEGNGHTVSGLNLTGSSAPAGLFATLQPTAVVRSLNVQGTVSPAGAAEAVGGLAGENYGHIQHCSFTGTVSGSVDVGGIAGVNGASGTIETSTAGGAVFGQKRTGGVVGCNHGVVNECTNGAYVNVTSVDPGIDRNDLSFATLNDLSALSNLDNSLAASDTGGIAGYSDGVLYRCANTSTVGYRHIGYNVGGVVGRSCGYLERCTNTAPVYGRKDVGGIAGQIEPYLTAEMKESTIEKLRRQLNELNALVDDAIDDAGSGMSSLTRRLNAIASSIDSAASALSGLQTTASVVTTVAGSSSAGASGSTSGSVTADPPDLEVSGGNSAAGGTGGSVTVTPGSVSGGTGGGLTVEGELSTGLGSGSVSGETAADGSAQASGNLSASTQVVLNTSLGGLTDAVNGMTSQMRALSGEAAGGSSGLTADMKAINDKITQISNTLFSALLGEEEEFVQDASAVDVDLVTLGKAARCVNTGAVHGDVSVGGIAGSMAVEHELDPEDDLENPLSAAQRRRYELRAILQECENQGEVTAKNSYAGGIAGKMDLGCLTGCENYGGVTAETGDYVGGVTGLTAGTVQNSVAKCTLRGGKYVGGVTGRGTDGEDGSGSTVSGCCALVTIPEYEQYAGAIAGSTGGSYLNNYFVSDSLQGIDRVSYAGQAEPVDYASLLPAADAPESDAQAAAEDEPQTGKAKARAVSASADGADGTAAQPLLSRTLPERFLTLTLQFVADGTVLRSVSFDYGASFDASVYPDIPQKEGYYARWDTETLENLCFDTTVTAVYTPYVTALASQDSRSCGRAVFFVEGSFTDADALTVTPLANTPAEFDSLPDGGWETLTACFTGTTLNREIVEQWQIEIPADGRTKHTVRYLAPDGDADDLAVYVKENGEWLPADAEAAGSYLCFAVSGSTAQVAVLSTLPVWWVWLIAGALVLALVLLLVRLVCKALARRPRRAAVAAAAGVSLDAPPTPEGADAAHGRTRRGLRPWLLLAAAAVLVAVTAAVTALVLKGSSLGDGLAAYRLLKRCTDRSSLAMTLEGQVEAGGTLLPLDAAIDRLALDGTAVTRVEQDGLTLYYADGAVFLENGAAFEVDSLLPDQSALLDQAAALFRAVEIEERSDGVYTLTVTGQDARELLALLAPTLAQGFTELHTVELTLTGDGDAARSLRFVSSGTLSGTAQTPFAVDAELTVLDAKPQGSIPQAVQEAVADPDRETGSTLTTELAELLAAWQALNAQEALYSTLTLSADCGPLVLAESVALAQTRVDGLLVTRLQKNGRTLYLAGETVCDEQGAVLLAADAPEADAARLLDMAYQACLHAQVNCARVGSETIYTAALDGEGLQAVAAALVPEIADTELLLRSGSVRVSVQEGRICSVQFRCSGSVPVVLTEIDAALGGELTFADGGEVPTIPAAVLKALTK